MEQTPGQVPSIGELRTLAQSSKTSADQRWSYLLFRRVSIYLTWGLLHTGATPNQVTVASLIVAAIGLTLMGMAEPWLAVGGYVAMVLYHLLDRVDGEIARFRKVYSLYGIYLDNAGHHLTSAGLFIATAYRLTGSDSIRQLWLLGSAAALAATFSRVAKHASFQLFSQYVLEQPGLVEGLKDAKGSLTREAVRADRAHGSITADTRPRTLVASLRDLVLTWTSFPATVTALGVGTLLQAIWQNATFMTWLFVAVSVLHVATYVALEAVNLGQNLAAETRRLWDDLNDRRPPGP